MATPHATGVAALLFEQQESTSAQDVWNILVQRAKPLPISTADVEAGLVFCLSS
jgi:hypothetical protein